MSRPRTCCGTRTRKELWLYFHGENTTTRLARSKDGIHFTYDKVVLSTSMLPAGTTETSYARVFRARPALARRPLRDGLHAEQHHQSP